MKDALLARRFRGRPDAEISELLAAMGCGESSIGARARAYLESIGLTRQGKVRIDCAKLDAVATALRSRFVLVCGDNRCDLLATKDLERIVSVALPCSICGGSEIRRAALRLECSVASRGMSELRLAVVGGSPATQPEVAALGLRNIGVRIAYGSKSQLASKVKRDIAWAHVLLIWSSTELAHKVSVPYVREARLQRVPMITCARRGLPALFECATEFIDRLKTAA